MAERKQLGSQSQSLAEGVDKELTCAICLSRYNQPKILPCLHSYCKGCLEDMLKKSREKRNITCPQCKVIHELPPEGIDGFTTFFTITNLLELLHIHENTKAETLVESIKCNNGLDENPAIARCLTCSYYLCESCCTIHRKQNLTKDHDVKTLEEIKQADKKIGVRSLHKKQYCKEHKDKLLELYCKTCKKVICFLCALVTHKTHDYAEIKEVRGEIQKQLEEHISKVQAKESEFQNHHKYTEKLLQVSNEAVKSSEIQVNQACNDLIQIIEVRRAKLLDEIHKIHETEVKQITMESASLELTLLRLSDSIRFTKQLLDNGDDVEVTAVSDQIEKTLTGLTEILWDKNMLKPSLMRPEFEPVKGTVRTFGKILLRVEPSDIIFSDMPPDIYVGKEFMIKVHLSEKISERGYVCEAVPEVTICHSYGSILTSTVVNDKQNNNSWTVHFIPDKPGEHKIKVQVGTASTIQLIVVLDNIVVI